MADVSLTGGQTGSGIALSGSDQLFRVTDGEVWFSTDSGTTYAARLHAGQEAVFYDGDTITPHNPRPVAAAFAHMDY